VKDRPTPEKMLKKAKQEESKQTHGKLKIFLGAAPGVGKTHAMLEEGLEKRALGLDVVIGIAESHGRKEIKSLIDKFEVLPKQEVSYQGKNLSEFDLDVAIKRSPGLILVDELAHTNVPGSRHTKRFQDILEILDRGIDVYTTLNVQHIESLNDRVAQIIGTQIKETIPDSLLELADTIEIVDLPPEDLLKRLDEGKIYFPTNAQLAKENFFRKGNLSALRELALRIAAQTVETQTFLYRQDLGIKQIWPTKEKIVVCVSPNKNSIKLIRHAKRLATQVKGEWLAVYVDRARVKNDKNQRNKAIQNLRFAEQLGGKTKILTGFDVVNEVLNYAREENVTLIIIGKRIRPRWKDLFSRRLADEMVRYSKEIDVYIVTDTEEKPIAEPKKPLDKKQTPWFVYGFAMGMLTIATLVNFLIFPHVSASNLIMIYLLVVTVVALFGEIGPSILASLLSVLTYDFFFVPPFASFAVTDIQYLITLGIMLLVATIISYLTLLIKYQANAAKFAEQQISSLHKLSRALARIRGTNKLLQTGMWHLADQFDSKIVSFLPMNDKGQLIAKDESLQDVSVDEKEQAVIKWVYDIAEMAGSGTENLPFFKSLYLPLLGFKHAIGVFRISPNDPNKKFTPEEMDILQASTHQIAIAIEVDRLQEEKIKDSVKLNDR
jgi:two-component system sensor histidine kinase KdpD